jgi:putative peptide zinc metalloprotease protein
MATLADSLVSSSARKLPIRRRPDLIARRQRYHGRIYWVVKDPVGLHYFRFQEEEYAILQMLDGETSLDEIKEQFEERFPPQKITVEEIQQFLGMLHRSGLILAGVQGQGTQLLKRRKERRKKELLGSLANVLCIRFKGIDPERLLTWLYPKVRFFFTRTALAACIVLALAALLLVAVQFQTFRSKLPEFHQFFSPSNAFLLALTLGLTKVLHEFGHGLSCKHFGGECHEMGVMILVLTPCLYCNVSDSWMLPSKWHRAAIGAAGMYVEAVLASVCTFLWWFSTPGLLNHLCLNVMFVCGVSTILFNANPLLRYDGYYILADLTEIPNLRQKATQILNKKAGDWFLGLETPDDPFLPQRNQIFFVLYSIAAVIYRWIVVFSILWFLYEVWKPYGLERIGQIIGLVALYGMFVHPLYKLGKFFYVPGRWDKVKKPRMYASLAGLAAILAAILLVPLPYSIMATLEIQARDAKSVFVEMPGQLVKVVVESGDVVQKGDPLARLVNRDIDLKVAELRGACATVLARIDAIQYERAKSPQAAGAIPELEEVLQAKKEELRLKLEDQAKLVLKAPRDGIVMPPPSTPPRKSEDGPLPSWSGTPLARRNIGSQGAVLDDTVLFCQIGDPRQMEAILVIDQADIPFIREGQRVELKIDQLPHHTYSGDITEVSRSDLKIAPRRLSNKSGGEMATKTDPETGAEKPISASYQARVPLEDVDDVLRLGLRGQARVYMGGDQWQTVGQRLFRFLARTFNFRL